MQFVSRIRGARDVHTLTPEEVRKAFRDGRGKDTFTLQEHFCGSTRVTAYYDFDAKYDEDPGVERTAALFSGVKKVITRLHVDVPQDRFRLAQRHGWVTAKVSGGKGASAQATRKYKLSFRAWVRGTVANASDIPAYVKEKCPLEDLTGEDEREARECLDLTVFKVREQLLGVLGGCKDIDVTKRFLVPINWNGERIPWEECDILEHLAQHVDEGAVAVAPTAGASAAGRKRGRKTKAQGQGQGVQAVDGTGKAEGTGGTEELTGPEIVEALRVSSDFFGDRYRMQEQLRRILVNRADSWLILPTVMRWCNIRRQIHARNNPYICITESGARFKCPDEDCRKQGELKAIPLPELPKPLRDLFTKTFHSALDPEVLRDAKEDCHRNIRADFPDENPKPEDTDQVTNTLMTVSQHRVCNACNSRKTSFVHREEGYQVVCLDCHVGWPEKYILFPKEQYPKLVLALNQLNVSIGTVNINNNHVTNIYNGDAQADFYADFSDDNLVAFPNDPELNALFIGSLQGTDAMLSRFTTRYFRERFHCTSTRRWFIWEKHCWSEDAGELKYKEAMSEDEFLVHYRRVALHFENLPIQTDDTKRKAKHLRKLCVALEDGKFRERIVQDSVIKFHDWRPTFAAELNTQNVMVFDDGVFNFDTMAFGPGSPDVPITLRVNQRYIPYDPENANSRFLLGFMHDILPDPSLCHYVLKILGLCLTTDVSQQFFYVWTGTGGNGKSRLIRLMETCLGPYCKQIPYTLLTRKREDANQSNDAVASLQGVRLAVFSEPENSETLQASTIKILTGEDTISAREMYGRQTLITPTCKTTFLCNTIPKVTENSYSFFRRFRVIGFVTSFVDQPVLAHERKIDYQLKSKLEAAAPYFIGVLIHYYQIYLEEGLEVPAAVTAATEQYKDSVDIVKEFVTERLVRDPSSNLSWMDLKTAAGHYDHKLRGMKRDVLRAELRKNGVLFEHTTVDGEDFNGFKGWRLL